MLRRALKAVVAVAWPPPRWLWALIGTGGAAVVVVVALLSSGQLRYWTGEEEALPQLRGLFHLIADRLRPQPDAAIYEAVAHADLSPYGINTFLEQEVEPEKRELAMQMIADAGFAWIRQEFPWEDIEIHGKGDYEDRRQQPYRSAWAKYDNIVDLAEQYGVEVIARLSNPPAWSRALGNEGGSLAPPDDLDDFGDYVATVVQRYKGRIHYYQIWNEPNIYPEWGNQPVDPEAYTELLRVAYTRAKEVDPDVVIICGALAATIENDLQTYGMSDFIFLQRMYDAGAADYFDVFSMQGYGLWSGPYDRRMRPRVLDFSRPLYLRDIMVQNGDAATPIWISEMNWNAIPVGHEAAPAYGRVTLEQQAEYVVAAYRRAQAEWPWLGVANFWFFKRATDAEANQSWYYFRMVDPDFTPMPVYDAMSVLTRETPVLGLGKHQETHWALAYDGDWQAEAIEGAEVSTALVSTSGTLSFRWRGRSLALRAAGPATVAVSVDGAMARTIAVPAALGDVAIARDLADCEHDVRIQVESGTLSIDAVTASQTIAWRWPAIGLGAAATVAALAVPAARRRRAP